MKNDPIVIERKLNAPIQRVWSALTNHKDMKQWYFDLPGFRPEVGYEFTFTAENEGRSWKHLCKVTEVVPGKKITYSWRYEGYPGNSFVTFELFPDGDKTKLKLSHTGLETFPQDVADLQRKNFETGWTDIIGRSLPEFLEKEPVHH